MDLVQSSFWILIVGWVLNDMFSIKCERNAPEALHTSLYVENKTVSIVFCILFSVLDNRNLLTYLANLIDIARFNSLNTHKLKELIDSGKVIGIANPMTMLFVHFDNEAIKDGFTKGEEFAEAFYKTYIKDWKPDNISHLNATDTVPNSQNQKLA